MGHLWDKMTTGMVNCASCVLLVAISTHPASRNTHHFLNVEVLFHLHFKNQ
jgi:hypothetical protein